MGRYTGRHNITEILLKRVWNTTQSIQIEIKQAKDHKGFETLYQTMLTFNEPSHWKEKSFGNI